MKIINLSNERLCQALRVLGEANVAIKHFNKLKVDVYEYLFNQENALFYLLEAYHKLFDDCKRLNIVKTNDLYNSAEIMSVILLRNLFHHNDIRTLEIDHLYKYGNKYNKKVHYFVIDCNEENANFEERVEQIKIYVKVSKFIKELNRYSKKYPKIGNKMKDYINLERFERILKDKNITNVNLYFDIMTIVINGISVLMKKISKYIKKNSNESTLFIGLFNQLKKLNYSDINVIKYSLLGDKIKMEITKVPLESYFKKEFRIKTGLNNDNLQLETEAELDELGDIYKEVYIKYYLPGKYIFREIHGTYDFRDK